jgi:hypothetical protein
MAQDVISQVRRLLSTAASTVASLMEIFHQKQEDIRVNPALYWSVCRDLWLAGASDWAIVTARQSGPFAWLGTARCAPLAVQKSDRARIGIRLMYNRAATNQQHWRTPWA